MLPEKSVFDITRENLSVDDRIVASLERIAEAFRVLLWEESKQNGLSPIQIQILIFLLFHVKNQGKVTYLAREFNMTKATISDAVKILEQKKLVTREYDEKDYRSFSLSLTKQGKIIAEKSSTFANVIRKQVDHLPEDNKGIFLSSLLTVISSLNQAGVITPQRMCHSCRFYGSETSKNFCQLIQRPLHDSELRVDCPEHEAK
jgi:DNA-binding MarR family transcriptional regulator